MCVYGPSFTTLLIYNFSLKPLHGAMAYRQDARGTSEINKNIYNFLEPPACIGPPLISFSALGSGLAETGGQGKYTPCQVFIFQHVNMCVKFSGISTFTIIFPWAPIAKETVMGNKKDF